MNNNMIHGLNVLHKNVIHVILLKIVVNYGIIFILVIQPGVKFQHVKNHLIVGMIQRHQMYVNVFFVQGVVYVMLWRWSEGRRSGCIF